MNELLYDYITIKQSEDRYEITFDFSALSSLHKYSLLPITGVEIKQQKPAVYSIYLPRKESSQKELIKIQDTYSGLVKQLLFYIPEKDYVLQRRPMGPTFLPMPAPTERYFLIIESTEGGEVTEPGEDKYWHKRGKTINLTAVPDEHHDFIKWAGDIDTIDDFESGETTIVMKGNYSIIAEFITQYKLTLSAGTGGSIIDPGHGTFYYSTEAIVDIEALPSTNYNFNAWTGHVGNVADVSFAKTIVTMESNYNIVATFVLKQRQLTIDSETPGGTVTDPGEGAFNYSHGSVIDLEVNPDIGYQFKEWTNNISTIPTSQGICKVVNGDVERLSGSTFSLNWNESAIKILHIDGIPYDFWNVYPADPLLFPKRIHLLDDTVNLEEKAFIFYHTQLPETTITMLADYAITATFIKEHTLTLSISPEGGGAIWLPPGPGAYIYLDGRTVNLKAIPYEEDHFDFLYWGGEPADVINIADVNEAETTVLMEGDYNIIATFVKQHKLTMAANPGGTVNFPGIGDFYYSNQDIIYLEAVPESIYNFSEWTGNIGNVTNAAAAATTVLMEGDYAITANFILKQRLLNIISEPPENLGGEVITPGEGNFYYAHFTKVEIEAVPNEINHWYFNAWSGHTQTIEDITKEKTEIEMLADCYIVANFLLKYKLNLSVTPISSGSITVPGEGDFWYKHDIVVDLTVVPETNYDFLKWTDGEASIWPDIPFKFRTGTISCVNSVVTLSEGDEFEMDWKGVISLNESLYMIESVVGPTVLYVAGENINEEGEYVYKYLTHEATQITMEGNYNIVAEFVMQHKLTITLPENGTVTTPGHGDFYYSDNSDVLIAAAPATGYNFHEWTGHIENILNPSAASTYILMKDNYTITANFIIKYHTLTLSSGIGGVISTPGEGPFSYPHFAIINIKATAEPLYDFLIWTEDTGTIANINNAETTIGIYNSYNVIATFVKKHLLNITAATGGSIVTPVEQFTYHSNEAVVDIEATPNTNYSFDRWTEDIGTIPKVTGTAYVVNGVMYWDSGEQFNLAWYGYIEIGEGTYLIEEVYSIAQINLAGEDINIEATGYTYRHTNFPSTTITMLNDYNIIATFVKHHKLILNSTEGGSVVSHTEEQEYFYPHKELVDIQATPDEHYNFIQWIGDNDTIDDITSAITTIQMRGDYNVTAQFLVKHLLQVTLPTGGIITHPGIGNFFHDTDDIIDLKAYPDSIYDFHSWTGNTENIANILANETTITIQGDYTITASFILKQRQLAVSSTEGGKVIEPNEEFSPYSYSHYSVIDIKAQIEEAWLFDKWTGDTGTIPESTGTCNIINGQVERLTGDPFLESFRSFITIGEGEEEEEYKITLIFPPNYLTLKNTTVNEEGIKFTYHHTYLPEATITMLADYAIVANFIKEHTLTISSTEGGVVNLPGEGIFHYPDNETINLKAVPSINYLFSEWTEDIENIANPLAAETTIEMLADTEIVANFILVQHFLHTQSGPGGTITTPGEGSFSYEHFSIVNIIATPYHNYYFGAWTLDIETIANPNTANTTIEILDEYSIAANFILKHKLTLSHTPTNKGVVSTPGEGIFWYLPEEEVELIAGEVNILPETWRFLEWTGGIATIMPATGTVSVSNGIVTRLSGDPFLESWGNASLRKILLQGNEHEILLVYPTDPLSEPPYAGTLIIADDTFDDPEAFFSYPRTQLAQSSIIMQGIYNVIAAFIQEFTLTIDSSEGGVVTLPGENSFHYLDGKTVELKAIPSENYDFDVWTGDISNIDNPLTAETEILIQGNYNITAVFILQNRSLTTAAGTGGTVIDPGLPGPFYYPHGSTVNIEAAPALNYNFNQWTGHTSYIDNINSAKTTIQMQDNYNITATFILQQRYLTLSSGTGGSVTNPGEGIYSYPHGQSVNLEGTPAEEYAFKEWTNQTDSISQKSGKVDAFNGVVTRLSGNSFSDSWNTSAIKIINLDGINYEYTHVFPTVINGHPGSIYIVNTEITLTNKNYIYKETQLPITSLHMFADYNIVAEFIKLHKLTITSSTGGIVTIPGETIPGEDPFEYIDGKIVNLKAVPFDNYDFYMWTEDTTTINNIMAAETTIEMLGDYSIVANFVLQQRTLYITSTIGGSVDIPGEGDFQYEHDSSVNLKAIATGIYKFNEWTGNTEEIANINEAETTITMLDDYSITANFIEKYKLILSSTVGGSVTTPGEGTFHYDDDEIVDIKATPSGSFYFIEWTDDIQNITDPYKEETTISMTTSATVKATFSELAAFETSNFPGITLMHTFREQEQNRDTQALPRAIWVFLPKEIFNEVPVTAYVELPLSTDMSLSHYTTWHIQKKWYGLSSTTKECWAFKFLAESSYPTQSGIIYINNKKAAILHLKPIVISTLNVEENFYTRMAAYNMKVTGSGVSNLKYYYENEDLSPIFWPSGEQAKPYAQAENAHANSIETGIYYNTVQPNEYPDGSGTNLSPVYFWGSNPNTIGGPLQERHSGIKVHSQQSSETKALTKMSAAIWPFIRRLNWTDLSFIPRIDRFTWYAHWHYYPSYEQGLQHVRMRFNNPRYLPVNGSTSFNGDLAWCRLRIRISCYEREYNGKTWALPASLYMSHFIPNYEGSQYPDFGTWIQDFNLNIKDTWWVHEFSFNFSPSWFNRVSPYIYFHIGFFNWLNNPDYYYPLSWSSNEDYRFFGTQSLPAWSTAVAPHFTSSNCPYGHPSGILTYGYGN